MKILVAPDSFKGSLSSLQAASAIERGIKRVDKTTDVIKVPMADGGEGTVEAIINAVGGNIVFTQSLDPLGREITSFFGAISNNTAVIEMSATSGINLLKPEERNPLLTTTYGTGQIIKAVLNAGYSRIIIGVGGSATNDGGTGMGQALGIKFLDSQGKQIGFGGGELGKISRIDISSLDPRIYLTDILVASDVKNVLCGPDGASAVYGPQKGATPQMVKKLDENLKYLAKLIKRDIGIDVERSRGSGAAGGLGAALIAFLGAKIRPGIEVVMETTKFEQKSVEADLVITGEGSTDYQTLFGKVPFGVAQAIKKFNKPVVCISGSLDQGLDQLREAGITAFFSILPKPMTLSEAMDNGDKLLEDVAENVYRIFKSGRNKPFK